MKGAIYASAGAGMPGSQFAVAFDQSTQYTDHLARCIRVTLVAAINDAKMTLVFDESDRDRDSDSECCSLRP